MKAQTGGKTYTYVKNNDDSDCNYDDVHSLLGFVANPLKTYLVVVTGYSDDSGNYEVTFAQSATDPWTDWDDHCEASGNILTAPTLGTPVGTGALSTETPDQQVGDWVQPYRNSNAPHSVLFCTDITERGTYNFSTCNASTDYDTWLTLVTQSYVGYNSDDQGSSCEHSSLHSKIEQTLSPGRYYVIVGGYDDDSGTFVLTVSRTA